MLLLDAYLCTKIDRVHPALLYVTVIQLHPENYERQRATHNYTLNYTKMFGLNVIRFRQRPANISRRSYSGYTGGVNHRPFSTLHKYNKKNSYLCNLVLSHLNKPNLQPEYAPECIISRLNLLCFFFCGGARTPNACVGFNNHKILALTDIYLILVA